MSIGFRPIYGGNTAVAGLQLVTEAGNVTNKKIVSEHSSGKSVAMHHTEGLEIQTNSAGAIASVKSDLLALGNTFQLPVTEEVNPTLVALKNSAYLGIKAAPISEDNRAATMADIIFESTAITTNRLNFLSFVTVQADKDKILANNATQTAATMSTYLTNAIAYCKANGVKMMYFPSGTYKFNGVTIDALNDFHLIGDNAIIKENNLTGTTALWKFTNSKKVKITGFNFIGTYGSYADYTFVHVTGLSGNFHISNNDFKNWRRSAIMIDTLVGGVASEGVNIHDNWFTSTSNYNNDLQTAITLGDDGEYCDIYHNWFKQIPSAIRGVNGANTRFSNNFILSTDCTFDPLYNRAIIYFDNQGSNNNKVRINDNTINHNGIGGTAIVLKGATSTPQNASTIEGNQILVHGSVSNSTAIYIENAPKTKVRGNHIRGNGTITSSAIIIKNSNNCYVGGCNDIGNYINGVELITSLNVKNEFNMFEAVTNDYVADGSSTWI